MSALIETLKARKGLFIPFAIAFAIILVHAVYWVTVCTKIEARAEAWLNAQKAAGYTLTHDTLEVGGYPFRFTLSANNPVIKAPAREGGWQAELDGISASAQFYNLNHWIITLGPEALWLTPQDGQMVGYHLASEKARLSVIIHDGRTARIGADIDTLNLSSVSGDEPVVSAIEKARLNGYVSEDDVFRLQVQIEAITVGQSHIAPAVADEFGHKADIMRLQANISSWSALATGNPRRWQRADGVFTVEGAQLIWGAAELQGTGDIGLDEALLPDGRLSLIVTDPNTLITALVQSGLVHEEQGEALRLFALMAPRRETGIALPFRLQNGGLFLGPARLGGIRPPSETEE